MSNPLSTTLSVAAALTTMALVPDTSTPPSVYWHLIVIHLVIVTPPKPLGSRQLISPPAAVLEIAPANVLHGAVRLHGFASSPTPDTNVRVAWAEAEAGIASAISASAGETLKKSPCGVVIGPPWLAGRLVGAPARRPAALLRMLPGECT